MLTFYHTIMGLGSEGNRQSRTEPAVMHQDIVPGVAIVPRCTGIYVGVGGTIVIQMPSPLINTNTNPQLTYLNVANGTVLPICPELVVAAGTTATNMIALYS